MSYADKIKTHVDTFLSQTGLDAALTHPSTFGDLDEQVAPGELSEMAQGVAAQREFTGAMLAEAERTQAMIDAILKAIQEDFDTELANSLADNANKLISRGWAIDERRANAKLSLADRMIDKRAAEMQRDRMDMYVKLLRAAYNEWRATEFAIDRIVRITNLRLNISEV